MFFFEELRGGKANKPANSALLAEACLQAGGTVFALIHGSSDCSIAHRMEQIGIPHLMDKASIDAIIADIRYLGTEQK